MFAAAPILSFARTNSVAFVPRRNLFLTNTAIPVQQLQVDFGDGRGYQTANWNQVISTVYTSAGQKRVKVKITFAYTIAPQESWFDFNVLSVVAAARGTTASSDFERPFPGDATHSGGIACVIFGNAAGVKHSQLTKPFIISEGYNLYDIAPELRKCNNPNNDIDEFFKKIDVNFLTAGTGTFRTNLLNAGYDIVYIDNAKGSDDITRNAQLFEAVVRWVNLNKVGGTASGQQNVVMGQSMGGLVSRYGLAEMTKRGNDNPHTRLLVLHDSPQRGAYNPVGVQSLGRSFDVPFLFGNSLADLNGQVRATVRVLNQPATQQLSILNAFNGRGTIQANTFIPNTYQPMIAFSGRPPYDIVAVSNGSQCGRSQNTPVGVTITESALALLLPIPYVGLAGVTGDFASYGLPAYGQQATVSRVSLRLEYRIRIGYCPICVTIPIRFNLLRESAPSPANTLPYETLPGGSTNPYQQAGSCADGFDFGSLNGIYAAYFRTKLYNGDLCFVPSYSALDVPTVTPATAFAKYVNNVTDNSSLPRVDRYIAQENVNNSGTLFNTAHISFTPRNSEWIYNEMQRPFNGDINPVACQANPECIPFPATPTIAGNNVFCLNGNSTNTYTVPNQPAGTTINWTATTTAGTVTPAAYTGPSYALTVNSASAGTVTIQAMVTKGTCTVATIQRRVTLGPQFRLLADRTQLCTVYLTVVAPGYDNLVLNTNSNGDQPVVDGSRIPVQYENRQVVATLTGRNTCTGQNSTVSATYTLPTSANCALRVISASTAAAAPTTKMFPNPAGNYVDVHVDRAEAEDALLAAATSSTAFTVRIYDTYGQLRQEQQSQSRPDLRLSTAALPAGLYVVTILRDGRVLAHQQLQIAR